MSKKQPITILSTNEEYLLDLFIGRFKYSNCPPTINPEWFERSFALDGFSTVSKAPSGELVNVSSTITGVSAYGTLPTRTITANPVLGSWTCTIGKDCVVGYNHTLPEPTLPIIKKYAAQLDGIDIDISVNINNLKTSRIFEVTSEAERVKLLSMHKAIDRGEPAIRVTSDLMSIFDNSKVQNIDIDFLLTDLIIARQNVISRYLTEIGIRSNLINKKERLTEGEIDVASHEADHVREDYIRNRTDYISRVNAMFGTSIQVDWQHEDINREVTENGRI